MPSEQQILIEAGNEAEHLLDSSAFSSVINELVEQTFQGFVNSAPDESAKREQLYSHYRAVVDVVSSLKQRVAIKDQIVTGGDSQQEEVDHE